MTKNITIYEKGGTLKIFSVLNCHLVLNGLKSRNCALQQYLYLIWNYCGWLDCQLEIKQLLSENQNRNKNGKVYKWLSYITLGHLRKYSLVLMTKMNVAFIHEPLTLLVRGPSLNDIRIWRLWTLDYDVYSRSPHWKKCKFKMSVDPWAERANLIHSRGFQNEKPFGIYGLYIIFQRCKG